MAELCAKGSLRLQLHNMILLMDGFKNYSPISFHFTPSVTLQDNDELYEYFAITII